MSSSATYGPPPVPRRMQLQRGAGKEETGKDSARVMGELRAARPYGTDLEAPLAQKRASARDNRIEEPSYLHPQHHNGRESTSTNRAVEERLKAMEESMLRLERQQQPRASEAAQANQLEQVLTENASLRKTMIEMGKHITSLEDLIIQRDEKTEHLQQQVLRLQENVQSSNHTAQEVTELRGMLREIHDAEKKIDANLLFAEIERVGKLCEALNTRIDHVRDHASSKLQNLERSQELHAQHHKKMSGQIETAQSSLHDFMGSIGRQVEGLRTHVIKLDKGAEEQRTSEGRAAALQSATTEELREDVARMDQKISFKLGTFMDELQKRCDADRASLMEQSKASLRECLGQIEQVRRSMDTNRQGSDEKVNLLQNEVQRQLSNHDMQLSEFRDAVELRLDILSNDVQREEAMRIDGVRRIHEDLTEQMNSMQGGEASSDGELTTLVAKLDDLEEVVRAEVRSRIRRETKAREHVENTSKTLQMLSGQVKAEMGEKLKVLQVEIRGLMDKAHVELQGDVSRVENRLGEERQARSTETRDLLERIATCEAKVAKRAATHQIDINRVNSVLAEQRQVLNAHQNKLDDDLDRLAQDVAQTQQVSRAQEASTKEACTELLEARVGQMQQHLDYSLGLAKEETKSQVHQSKLELSRVISDLDDALKSLAHNFRSMEAEKASEACISNILDHIEQDEHATEKRSALQEQVEELKSQVERTKLDLKTQIDELDSRIVAEAASRQDEILSFHDEAMSSCNSLLDGLRHDVTSESALLQENLSKVLLELEETRKLGRDTAEKLALTEVGKALDHILDNVAAHSEAGAIANVKASCESLDLKVKALESKVSSQDQLSERVEHDLASVLRKIEEEKLQQKEDWEASVKDAQAFLKLDELPTSPVDLDLDEDQFALA